MGNDQPHARARLRLPLLAIVGVVLVAAAAVPGMRRAQDGAPAPESRPGDPAAYVGWGRSHFPHELHVEDLDIACADCHHETNASHLVMPHDDYFDDFWIDCTICHRESAEVALEPRYCGDCHHDSPAKTADETLSSKVVVHQLCWDCHDRGTGAEAAGNCAFCHDEPNEPN